jgi:hypothetical protein
MGTMERVGRDRELPLEETLPENRAIAARLEEAATLLEHQGGNPFRVGAFRRGAQTLRELDRPASEILARQGVSGLDRLPGIGPVLARAVFSIVCTGRLPMLDRLRGESDPTSLLASVPGIGAALADRLYHDAGIATLEDLEAAAHDGRLEKIPGLGRKRIEGVRDSLAVRLARIRSSMSTAPRDEPPVSELLDVDREYRMRAAAGALRRIAPRRFNPERRAWLPILHARRGPRFYTALFSNTARAHRLDKTRDWVVLYADGRGSEGPWTVVTETTGEQRGSRVVRGREAECREASASHSDPPTPESVPAAKAS